MTLDMHAHTNTPTKLTRDEAHAAAIEEIHARAGRDGAPYTREMAGSPRRVIRFYAVGEEYGAFSNFAPYPIMVGGQRWTTSEHYFQAQKLVDPGARDRVRAARTPAAAARIGRDRANKIRHDWESVKVGVMREALRAKFTQHAELRDLLLETADALLVEHTENDQYWGDGGDGSGKNVLGKLLMELRESLRANEP